MLRYGRISLGIANCYLVETGGGHLLIDCGSRGDGRTLERKLRKKGIGVDGIQFILLTHHHGDHCGLLSHLVSRNPGIRVILSENCAERLTSGRNGPSSGYAGRLSKWIFRAMERHNQLTFPPYMIRGKRRRCQ